MSSSPAVDERVATGVFRDDRPSARGWLAILAVFLLIIVGLSPLSRPSPRGLDAPPAEFSAVRAMAHVKQLAKEPHPMGSAALQPVEAYVRAQLDGMGLVSQVQEVEVPDYFGTPGGSTVIRNIIGTIPGTGPSKAITLVAHYDTHPASPGANDNGVGVAVLLEVARAALSGDRPANDIVLLFTDGEEPAPRYGANAFADAHPAFTQTGLVVGLEANGSSGPSLLIESSRSETGIVEGYRRAASHPAAFSFLTEMVDLFGGVGTDFDVFKARDVPGLSFAYLRGSPIYHTARDVPDSVSLHSVQHHGDNVMALIEAYGSAQLPPRVGGAETVFFPLTSIVLVGYSSVVAVGLAVVSVVTLSGVVWLESRSNRESWARIGRGCLVAVVGASSAALVVFVSWWLLTAMRSTPRIWESYLYLCALCVVAAYAHRRVGDFFAGRLSYSELAVGPVAVWVVLGVATTIMLPGFSYLFVWPAIGGVVALAIASRGRGAGWLWLAAAAPATVLAIPALDAFFQMAQPRPGNPDSDLTVAVALVGFLVALVVGLVMPFWPARPRSQAAQSDDFS